MNMLRSTRATAFEQKIEALIHLIQEDLGYELHRAVQKVKCALSTEPAALFRVSDGVIEIEGRFDGRILKNGLPRNSRRSNRAWMG